MAAPVFDHVAGEIERRSALSALEARGTLRLALRRAGLDPNGVTGDQMRVVLERVLPDEIRARGVPASDEVCRAIAAALRATQLPDATDALPESPEAIFRRLARGP
jgi:hypothetical protein